jgi:hypothetical protein
MPYLTRAEGGAIEARARALEERAGVQVVTAVVGKADLIVGVRAAVILLVIYVLGHPIAKSMLGRTAWYQKAAQHLKTKGTSSLVGFVTSSGGCAAGSSSGGGLFRRRRKLRRRQFGGLASPFSARAVEPRSRSWRC